MLLLGATSAARAQQTPATIRLLPEDAQRQQNGNQHNFYFLPPGATGENYQNAGFFGQKLRPYLAGNEEALTHLNYYRRQKTLFLIDRIVAVGAIGVYGQQVFEKDKFPQYFSDVQKVAAGIFVTSLLATIFINNNTNQHFQRAVTSYNAGKSQGTLWHRLQPSGVGVGSTLQGQPTLALRWELR
ncbi:hypothetical protein Q5H93_10945 [Hymenobacter sp. ASUV-10]|uniref:DUF5683 domain-containing protein n=1 Tax=Hymenobacter aranciens TaxID=3063996 RepID=A0ABT9BAF6_9BACT|nr:hypothetical protein [Hymenobacter sp. ASUV-10]MDO7875250.1 hypothetical protein [Hymenobacter sp. ASUV-10]